MDTAVAPSPVQLWHWASLGGAAAPVASTQDGTYPRPQLVRERWSDLSGTWSFRWDDADEGLHSGWGESSGFGRTITVPFPPESAASGIAETGLHRVAWYQRAIGAHELEAAGEGARMLLHFGAVDYRAAVWLNGRYLGSHEGGHTPFSFDVTDALVSGEQSLVVRAEDDPLDVGQPRGKQDWQQEPHSIWYHRTTGIWQPVWLEAVPALAITHLEWVPDAVAGAVTARIELSRRPIDARVTFDLAIEGERLASLEILADGDRLEVTVPIARQVNGQNYEELLWSDRHPRLIDARVTVGEKDGADVVASYLGLRSASIAGGHFLLNDRPFYLRSVLSQGYWPDSHLAAPSPAALRSEVESILSLGFNAARVHQKIEDPRFLYWADRLGLLLWEEMPSVYESTPTSMRRLMSEWAEVIRRDSSHPSVVTWVPLNESWGVQHIAHSPTVQNFSRAIWHQTRALDGTRPVVSNDGWEHLDSDIWSVHDYEADGEVVRERYADAASVDRLLAGLGPAGRRMRLADSENRGQPVMLTEFGGVKFDRTGTSDAWGYSVATSADDFERRLGSLLDGVRASAVLAGFCYTQLTDTGQEVNGLLTGDREPKLPTDTLRAIITGEPERSDEH
jgi:beta-galactosidase/beta-glucuronidase